MHGIPLCLLLLPDRPDAVRQDVGVGDHGTEAGVKRVGVQSGDICRVDEGYSSENRFMWLLPFLPALTGVLSLPGGNLPERGKIRKRWLSVGSQHKIPALSEIFISHWRHGHTIFTFDRYNRGVVKEGGIRIRPFRRQPPGGGRSCRIRPFPMKGSAYDLWMRGTFNMTMQ